MEYQTETSVPLSSLGRRVVALFLDCLIFAIPGAVANHLIPIVGGLIAWFFYAPVLEASQLRATLGKHLMGIQVADLSGQRVSLRAAVIRNLLKIVSTALLFFGFIVALFSKRKQTLHDMLADTIVIRGKVDISIPDAWMESARNVFDAGSSVITEQMRPSNETMVEQLERLQSLREKGAISEDEFQKAKAKILGTSL